MGTAIRRSPNGRTCWPPYRTTPAIKLSPTARRGGRELSRHIGPARRARARQSLGPALVGFTGMRTLVLDSPTDGLDELLERRRRSGLDRLDEVWEGVYHMVPAPSGPHATIESQLHRLLGPF